MQIATHNSLTNSHTKTGSATGFVVTLGALYRRWQERNAERKALERLDERDLRDVGLTRYSVERELARPFWRG
jgi:uncharacterized protein YjiS (DUF1127 family)